MSIAHLKKQAKNLSRLLPTHLTSHNEPTSLSACQELIAGVNGYPSWHTAVTRHSTEAASVDEDPHPATTIPTVPAQEVLIDDGADRPQDPAPGPSGVLDYSGPATGIAHQGRYWCVDIGFSPHVGRPRTAIVFDPIDSPVGQRFYDGNLLLNRDDMRCEVAEHIWRLIGDSAKQKDKPELFILVVHKRGTSPAKELWALCFDWTHLGAFAKRAHIEQQDFASIYNTVVALEPLPAYERLILREALNTTRHPSASRSNDAMNRTSRHAFEYFLNFCRGVPAPVLHQSRQAGLRFSIESGSWMDETLRDLQRFDPHLRDFFTNSLMAGTVTMLGHGRMDVAPTFLGNKFSAFLRRARKPRDVMG